MYPIPANAIIQFQVVGRLHGQRTRNVFHYQLQNALVPEEGTTLLAAFTTFLRGSLMIELASVSSVEQKFEGLRTQVVSPTRFRAIDSAPGPTQGGVAGNSLPSSMAVVVSLFSEFSGRELQGRKFLPGVPNTYELDSRIDPQFLPNYDTLVALMAEPITVTLNGTDYLFVPTLLHRQLPTNPGYKGQNIKGSLLRDILRVQRRREIGVGE